MRSFSLSYAVSQLELMFTVATNTAAFTVSVKVYVCVPFKLK